MKIMTQRLTNQRIDSKTLLQPPSNASSRFGRGIGSCLRPWTNSVPKPLPMLDRTLLEQVIYTVPTDLIDEVVVAGGYKVEMIKSYFDSIECDFDVRIVNETDL